MPVSLGLNGKLTRLLNQKVGRCEDLGLNRYSGGYCKSYCTEVMILIVEKIRNGPDEMLGWRS